MEKGDKTIQGCVIKQVDSCRQLDINISEPLGGAGGEHTGEMFTSVESLYPRLPCPHGQRSFRGAFLSFISTPCTWLSVNFCRIPTTGAYNPETESRQGSVRLHCETLAALAVA